MVVSIAAPAVIAAVLSFLLTPVARWLAGAVGAVDMPDARKIHRSPMPRLGGLAVLCAFALVLVAARARWLPSVIDLPEALWTGVALGVIPVAAISFLDDVRGVRARWKALVHVGAALIAVKAGVVLNPEIHFMGEPIRIGLLAVPLSILWIVGVTNAFNLVDGLDGLSAGLALISSVSLSVAFLMAGERAVAGAVLVLAGALVGFLPYNLYPAKIFLGDTGAAAVGFILACFALKGGSTLSAGFATVLPILVLGVPVAETLISIARRLLGRLGKQKSGVFDADRDHIHHRLLGIGLDHRRAVYVMYGVGASLAAIGLISLFVTARQAALLMVALLLAAFIGIKRLGYDEFAFVRRGLVLRVYEAPVVKTSLFAVFFDMVLVGASYYIARGLKFEIWTLKYPSLETTTLVALLLLLSVGTFFAFGLYRSTWSLASLDAMVRCAAAAGTSAFLAWGLAPRFTDGKASATLFGIYALVVSGMVCGSRISYRLLQHQAWKASVEGEPILIYGAGQGGAASLRELRSNPEWRMRPVGFVDDDPSLQGRLVSGMLVVGTIEDLESLLMRYEARGLAVASRKIPLEKLRAARAICKNLAIPVYRFDMRFNTEDSDIDDGGRLLAGPGLR